MINRLTLLIVLLTLSGCGCSYLWPYYPLSPTVRLGQSHVSNIEIMPTPSAAIGTSTAPNSSGTYTGNWNSVGSSNYTGQWNYSGTNIQNSPTPPINNVGTLSCGDTDHKKSGDIPETRECEVKKAIDYANAANDKYLKAQSQHADMPGIAALALLPAAGSASALGIEGMGATAITGLGVGAATLLGLGVFLHPNGREKVYSTGALGIQCMLENMAPYTRIDSNDLFILTQMIGTQTIGSGTDPSADDNGDESNRDLTRAKARLDNRINNVEALGLQSNCTRCPSVMRIASLLLKAAKAVDEAAEKTIETGNDFARTALAAPITIVNTTDHINAALNEALIATEPSMSDLANNIKSTIPNEQAQALAGLSAAKDANAKAQTKVTAANTGPGEQAQASAADNTDGNPHNNRPAPKASGGQSSHDQQLSRGSTSSQTTPSCRTQDGSISYRDGNISYLIDALNLPPNTTFKKLGSHTVEADSPSISKPHTYCDLKPPGPTAEELISLIELERSIYVVNKLTSQVLRIVGSYTGKLNIDKCPTLTKQTDVPSSMKLTPSDDIVLAAGSKTTIAISGATNPYTRPLFPQSVCSAVTATLNGGEIDVAATATTTSGFYPFFAGDGATGQIFNVMVTATSQTGNTDEVQKC